ncbi:MAG: transcription-repair coupling factor, partial [Bacteroidales bacterium]|nr:transcription-repair coupling factor [Bacteroidales bacterium]
MDKKELISRFTGHPKLQELFLVLEGGGELDYHLKGHVGSSLALIAAASFLRSGTDHWFVLHDQEAAAYFYNDLESLFDESRKDLSKKRVLYFPASWRRQFVPGQRDNDHILQRTEVLNRIGTNRMKSVVVTYPEALVEKVAGRDEIREHMMMLRTGEAVDLDFVADLLLEYGFDRADFVVQPGQFAIRGGIVDVYSYSGEYPFRIEFSGNRIDSMRTFDPVSQLSRDRMGSVVILPDVESRTDLASRKGLPEVIGSGAVWWLGGKQFIGERMTAIFESIGSE